jgi:hypothetical protein
MMTLNRCNEVTTQISDNESINMHVNRMGVQLIRYVMNGGI